MENRGLFVIFAFFLVLFFIPYTSAASDIKTCSSPEQVIMSLYYNNDSHAALWDDSNYMYKICYYDVFGEQYAGSDPHTCTGGNRVIWLSGTTNAHANESGGIPFDTQVCYGNLNCRIVPSNEVNLAGEKTVSFLTSKTNAHIASWNYAGTDYPYKIVCSNSAVGDIGSVYWRDYAENPIDESYVNRTVKMVAYTSLPDGTSVNFAVYGGSSLIKNSAGIVVGNKAVGEWYITDDEIAGKSKFYFDASYGGAVNRSSDLKIYDVEGKNTAPKATILSPEHRQIYFKNNQLQFNGECVDIENPASYSWEIRDENNSLVNIPLELADNKTFMYSFITSGQKTITLKCVDYTKTISGEDQIAILSTSGGTKGIIAFINEPRHLQIIKNSDYGVKYSANDSYVINQSLNSFLQGSCPVINCLAGNCPSETKNLPASSSCSSPGGKIPISGGDRGFSSLNFSWSFDDGYKYSAMGVFEGVKVYGAPSQTANDKKITLLLNYTSGGISLSQKTERRFTLTSDEKIYCDTSRGILYLYDDNGNLMESRDTSKNLVCAGPDGDVEGTADNCCPSGQVCVESNGGRTIGCVVSDVEKCGDYTDVDECNDDVADVVRRDPLWDNDLCDLTDSKNVARSCSCFWNSTLSGGKCVFKMTETLQTQGSVCDKNKIPNCQREEPNLKCTPDSGVLTGTTIAHLYQPEGACTDMTEICKNGEVTIDCTKRKSIVSFFGGREFIVSSIIVLVLYIAMFRKEILGKKKRKR